MRRIGELLRDSIGLLDADFFQTLPAADANTLFALMRAMCPKHALTLLDGAATPTGAVVNTLEGALSDALGRPVHIIRSNTSMECWRTPNDKHCVTPPDYVLELLGMIKDLFLICLEIAGIEPVCRSVVFT